MSIIRFFLMICYRMKFRKPPAGNKGYFCPSKIEVKRQFLRHYYTNCNITSTKKWIEAKLFSKGSLHSVILINEKDIYVTDFRKIVTIYKCLFLSHVL